MARKPFKGTVAANVLEHGTGALNVDGCRVGTSKNVPASVSRKLPANCYGKYAESGETGAASIFGAGASGGSFTSAYANDSGSAARFFYTAKATRAERQGVTHPTVKPLDLMAYLCRLVTPPGGTVLDPFMGSGTTIKAALSEGFNAIGIEREPAYFAMAEHRMNGAQLGLSLQTSEAKNKELQP
jgi:site-specific DNA-methyltransferase (adenine-specific)